MSDPQATRALAQLEMCADVLPRLFDTLGALRNRALQAAQRQGVTPTQWDVMTYPEREALLARDRRQRHKAGAKR